MRWEIEERVVCELWAFTGVNFGGTKKVVRIHAYGGRQGDAFPGDEVKSLGIIARPGIRVILQAARSTVDWESLPWRCFQLLEGKMTEVKDGRSALQIPDLDRYDPWDANRSDPDLVSLYPAVDQLDDGKGWTFGRRGTLKCNVRGIRIERIP